MFTWLMVLKKGYALSNAEAWKAVGAASTSIFAILTLVLATLPTVHIPVEVIQSASTALASLGSVVFAKQAVSPEVVQNLLTTFSVVVTFLCRTYFKWATDPNLGIGTAMPSDGSDKAVDGSRVIPGH